MRLPCTRDDRAAAENDPDTANLAPSLAIATMPLYMLCGSLHGEEGLTWAMSTMGYTRRPGTLSQDPSDAQGFVHPTPVPSNDNDNRSRPIDATNSPRAAFGRW
ncbi:hypothetical protein V499_06419 [Pseudogymnoascus sp. VKM F-103]|uniref:Uncharacterized protein n=1 Tax=Pseudogymnoascus verrucosus TaxID=342668 RepID=A0A1B8GHU1_9PEZI|nr:uncharacterized protein VE01_05235 [Pseudogymnoascus verrucosus]KFY73503.1 hypothetical protein V499_06419 [Pseudogymnoascus sp. VKM F-103]OBT95411.1 hypothetical protein VE01_05235 [Pseudogymnoascus verrucosus]